MWTYDGSTYDFEGSPYATREVERMAFIFAYNYDYTTEDSIDLHAVFQAYALAHHYKIGDVVEYAKRCFDDFRSVSGNSSIVGMLARCYDFKEV